MKNPSAAEIKNEKRSFPCREESVFFQQKNLWEKTLCLGKGKRRGEKGMRRKRGYASRKER